VEGKLKGEREKKKEKEEKREKEKGEKRERERERERKRKREREREREREEREREREKERERERERALAFPVFYARFVSFFSLLPVRTSQVKIENMKHISPKLTILCSLPPWAPPKTLPFLAYSIVSPGFLREGSQKNCGPLALNSLKIPPATPARLVGHKVLPPLKKASQKVPPILLSPSFGFLHLAIGAMCPSGQLPSLDGLPQNGTGSGPRRPLLRTWVFLTGGPNCCRSPHSKKGVSSVPWFPKKLGAKCGIPSLFRPACPISFSCPMRPPSLVSLKDGSFPLLPKKAPLHSYSRGLRGLTKEPFPQKRTIKALS